MNPGPLDSAKLQIAQMWVDNTFAFDGTTFVHITGPQSQKQQYIDTILTPILEGCVATTTVTWAPGVQTIAIVARNNTTAEDTDAIQESVSGWFREEVVTPETRILDNSFSKSFEDGFEDKAANYSASLRVVRCNPDKICPLVALCVANDVGLGCNADCRSSAVSCVGNCCLAKVAFMGYCGFPSVEFSVENVSFSVSGWGWQYFSSTVPLDDCCP